MYIFLSIVSIFSIYLLYRLNKISKKVKSLTDVEDPNTEIDIKPLLKRPEFNSVDTNHYLLKDIIESFNLENWTYEITDKTSRSSSDSWRILIKNPNNKININSRLSLYGKNIGFNFHVMSDKGSINYPDDVDNLSRRLIIEFLWSIITSDNEKENQIIIENYRKSKKIIESELISLNRDRKLKKII